MFSWENHRTKWWMFQCHGFFSAGEPTFVAGNLFCSLAPWVTLRQLVHPSWWAKQSQEFLSKHVPIGFREHWLNGGPRRAKKNWENLIAPNSVTPSTWRGQLQHIQSHVWIATHWNKMVGLPKILVKLSHRSCYTYPWYIPIETLNNNPISDYRHLR